MLVRMLFHLSLLALLAWAISSQERRLSTPDPETTLEAALSDNGWVMVGNEAEAGTTLARMRVFRSAQCDGNLLVGAVASTGDLHHFLTLQTGVGGKVLYLRNGSLSDRPPHGLDYIAEKLRNLAGANRTAADGGPAVALVRTGGCTDIDSLPWPFAKVNPTQTDSMEGSS